MCWPAEAILLHYDDERVEQFKMAMNAWRRRKKKKERVSGRGPLDVE
jgi:hypothetical protein